MKRALVVLAVLVVALAVCAPAFATSGTSRQMCCIVCTRSNVGYLS